MVPNRPATSTKHKKINKWLKLRDIYWKSMIVTFLVNFALNMAFFSPIQIPIKWLLLLDLKLCFEGWIAQTQFKWNFRLSISSAIHVWDLIDVLMALHSALLRCTSLKLRSLGAHFSEPWLFLESVPFLSSFPLPSLFFAFVPAFSSNSPVNASMLRRLSRMWRIMQIEKDVIFRDWRLRCTTSSEIYIILHIIRKPNSVIVLCLILNISKFLKYIVLTWAFLHSLAYFSAPFQDVNGRFSLQISLKK